MPNIIDANGLQTATQSELVNNFTTAFQTIYGADIDLSSNSPDGQMMMIFLQAVLDLEDLLTQIYNTFDPDNAIGVVLDQRVAINGIQRQNGTPTLTQVLITVTQALNLFGLDQTLQPVYTVADNAGNQYQLLITQFIASPGTYSFPFQAAVPGALNTIPNTITVPVTIVLGVTVINNPSPATTIGEAEESDAALRLRRQKSVSLASQGYYAGLLAALENIPGVTSAFIEENTSDIVNADGVPGHSIWVIVGGTGAASAIAQAIYTKRNAGCGMFGTVFFVITQVDGNPFVVYWDDVVEENLFIRFDASSLNGIQDPNIAAIVANLPSLFIPGVFGLVNDNYLATLVQQIDPNTLVSNAGFSVAAAGSYTPTLLPSTKNKQFLVTSPNIIVLPMILYPKTASVANGGATQQFTPAGGFAPYTYSIDSGGGSISGSGLYTSAGAGNVVVRATDSLGNFATSTVTVT